MKAVVFPVPIAAALLLAGCVSVLPKPPPMVPKYSVELSPAAVPPPDSRAGEGLLLVVGRVRAADDAVGTALRVVDLETGRAWRLRDGELAQSPEAILKSAIRANLTGRFPAALVCDASVAPHGGRRTTVEAWIEKFRLEKFGDAWAFSAEIVFTVESPEGGVTGGTIVAQAPVAVAEGAVRPTAATAAKAIADALSSFPFVLENNRLSLK